MAELRTPKSDAVPVSHSVESRDLPNDGQKWKKPALAAASLVAVAGLSTLVYQNWEGIKRFFKWGQLANDAAADSVVLLESKIDSAIAFSDAPRVDLVSLQHAVDLAIDEARNLVAINQQLRDKLRHAVQHGKSSSDDAT